MTAVVDRIAQTLAAMVGSLSLDAGPRAISLRACHPMREDLLAREP